MERILIGILLDVSGSMKRSVGSGVDEEGGAWVRSIFSVIDNLIKHDLKKENHVFAIGVGARHAPTIFDLLGTLEHTTKYITRPTSYLSKTINSILSIAERRGARTVRRWASMELLIQTLSYHEDECSLILKILESDLEFVEYFVDHCLPSACRDYKGDDPKVGVQNFFYENVGSKVGTKCRTATEDDIKEVLNMAKSKIQELLKNELKSVSAESVFKVHHAHTILHGYVDKEEDLTKKRTQELMTNVEPFIYGNAPLIKALEKSAELFSCDDFRGHNKLLFVLSDGEPTDGEAFSTCSVANQDDILVVSCFITTSTAIDPRMLFSTATANEIHWGLDAKSMFNLSSTIPTQKLPRTIFVKSEWKVDTTNNETKLFLQVNHPAHLKDACNLARDVATSQEALSDVLASIDLDIYINQSNAEFRAQNQGKEATCYANASAAVLHLAMKRIIGREEGYPDFEILRKEMINSYGKDGADTRRVLEEICPKYRLKCQRLSTTKEALEAIVQNRPILARFRLSRQEQIEFKMFFIQNPNGVLSKKDINTRQYNARTMGHAVVLTSFNSKCLRLMNSWGSEWADNGFFSVEDSDVLGLEFFDVFWTLDDLTNSEKEYHGKHGAEVADKLMKDLKGLQEATFQCPLCHNTSKVTAFTGRLTRATCPKCKGEFKCNDEGNILALNLYLTSLCYQDNQQRSDRNLRAEDSRDSQQHSYRNLSAQVELGSYRLRPELSRLSETGCCKTQ